MYLHNAQYLQCVNGKHNWIAVPLLTKTDLFSLFVQKQNFQQQTLALWFCDLMMWSTNLFGLLPIAQQVCWTHFFCSYSSMCLFYLLIYFWLFISDPALWVSCCLSVRYNKNPWLVIFDAITTGNLSALRLPTSVGTRVNSRSFNQTVQSSFLLFGIFFGM